MLTINTWVFVILYFLFGIVSYLLGAAVDKFILSEKGQIKAGDSDFENTDNLAEKLTVLSDADVFREEDGSYILKGKEGSMLKLSDSGISIYDPEAGTWRYLN